MNRTNLNCRKNFSLKLILILIILLVVILIHNTTYAINTEAFGDIYDNIGQGDLFTNVGAKVLGVAQVIGMAVAIIFIIILGVKYMYSSAASDKADIKTKLIPYFIGAVILFLGSSFLNVIINFTRSILK